MEEKLKEKLIKFKEQNKNHWDAEKILDYFMSSYADEFDDVSMPVIKYLDDASYDLNILVIEDKDIHKEMEKMLDKAIQMIEENENNK